jgi:hypothetical protein
MPDAFYRLLAYPNGIAMIVLGYSLWATARRVRRDATPVQTAAGSRRVTKAGAR